MLLEYKQMIILSNFTDLLLDTWLAGDDNGIFLFHSLLSLASYVWTYYCNSGNPWIFAKTMHDTIYAIVNTWIWTPLVAEA